MKLKSGEKENFKNALSKMVFIGEPIFPNKLSDKFNLTRQTIYKYLNELLKENQIEKLQKKGKLPIQYTPILKRVVLKYDDLSNTSEDEIWSKGIEDHLENLNNNCKEIMHYCCTEIINNALEHSGTEEIIVIIGQNHIGIEVDIIDRGVGIFEKIYQKFKLEDKRHAIFELKKGKTTTSPENHTGEGIFFSSRSADLFSIFSDDLIFANINGEDVLSNIQDKSYLEMIKKGTTVKMRFVKQTKKDLNKIFNRYADPENDDYSFNKTTLNVETLMLGDSEQLISRSQAKRLLSRLDKFKFINLNFQGVKKIGQGFADEIFRVFQNNNPNIKITTFNTSKKVEMMINKVKNNNI